MRQDLYDVASKQRMSVGWVLLRWLSLLAALEFLHCRVYVLHGDVSPGNILVDEFGHCVLADFGHAQRFDASTHWPQRCLHGIGTLAYAPPERWGRPPDTAGPASDRFGLAAVMCISCMGSSANQPGLLL